MMEQDAGTPSLLQSIVYWQPALLVRRPYDELTEGRSADQLWDMFSLLVADTNRAQQGRKLQSAPELIEQYRGFIRQAKSYWDAAVLVRDAAAALLYYYCFLNLAKAELLPLKQSEVEADPQHGLGVRPSQQDDADQARVRVELTGPRKPAPQLFEMLYEKRTGYALPNDIPDIAVMDALRRIPEIGFEVTEFGRDQVMCLAYHAITADSQFNARSSLLLLNVEHVLADANVSTRLNRLYEKAPRSTSWRDLYALSPRVPPTDSYRLHSRETYNVRSPSDPEKLQAELGASYWLDRISDELHGIVEAPGDTTYDGYLLPSLLKDRLQPLPIGLSRYIGFYYASALVRYRPSALDPVSKPMQTWLLGSFIRQAALPLLQDFYNHMAVKPLVFHGIRP
jgi:YaaC-like Protein